MSIDKINSDEIFANVNKHVWNNARPRVFSKLSVAFEHVLFSIEASVFQQIDEDTQYAKRWKTDRNKNKS